MYDFFYIYDSTVRDAIFVLGCDKPLLVFKCPDKPV